MCTHVIPFSGRPKRRGVWPDQKEPPSSTYVRSLNSSSDSDQENDTRKGRRRATDWANLQGIISDDANSDWSSTSQFHVNIFYKSCVLIGLKDFSKISDKKNYT